MALNPSNGSDLEQLVLKGLIVYWKNERSSAKISTVMQEKSVLS